AAAKRVASETGQHPPVIVDNTFLGPLWQRPLAHGCDLAVYSLTKYIGGHSDLVAGGIVGARNHVDRIRPVPSNLAPMIESYTGWLLMRSLETLKLRMTAAMNGARAVAEFLRAHPKIARVHYLGFLTQADSDHALYHKQCTAPGSTFSFDVKGGEREAF